MSDRIHLDPVADGRPEKISRVAVVLIAALVLIGAWSAYTGDWIDAWDAGLFAVLIYIYERSHRTYWMSGYAAGAEAVAEQAPCVERETDD